MEKIPNDEDICIRCPECGYLNYTGIVVQDLYCDKCGLLFPAEKDMFERISRKRKET